MARKTEAEVKAEGEWIGLAWAAYVSGEATITALARQFDKSWATMKRALKKHSAARAAELSVVNADAEYIDGLRHDLRRAEQIAREAENPNAKVGALKLCVQIREKLAAALGVTTERIGLEHSTDPNNPLTFQIIQFGADDNGGGNREPSPAGD
jgi:transposase-like protein